MVRHRQVELLSYSSFERFISLLLPVILFHENEVISTIYHSKVKLFSSNPYYKKVNLLISNNYAEVQFCGTFNSGVRISYRKLLIASILIWVYRYCIDYRTDFVIIKITIIRLTLCNFGL